MKSKSIFLALALALGACSAAQLDAGTTKFEAGAKVACKLDGVVVPIGQDAAVVLAPVVGAANPAAGGLVVGGVALDKALVHPAVVAVCASLVGAGAVPVAVPVVAPVAAP